MRVRPGAGPAEEAFYPGYTLPAIRIDLANYARLRTLVDRWIDLATQLSDLTLELRAAGDKPTKRA